MGKDNVLGLGLTERLNEAIDAQEKEAQRSAQLEKELRLVREENALLRSRAEEANNRAESLELVVDTEKAVVIEQLEHDLRVALGKIKQLELEQAGVEVLKEENKRLGEKLLSLQDEMSDMLSAHAQEAHAIKSETFHSRYQLENTFRKALQEMDYRHQQQAFEEMDQESKNALIEKARVQEELALQTMGIEALTNRYRAVKEKLQLQRTDNSILQEHQKVQSKKLAAMKEQIKQLEDEGTRARAELQTTKERASEVDGLQARVSALETELAACKTALGEAEARASKYKGKLLRTAEALKRHERAEAKEKSKTYFSPNSELLKTLAELGNAGRQSDAGPGTGPESRDQQADQHNFVHKVSLRKIPGDMKECRSMPALRKSQYTGILETWNEKYSAVARK